jgi:hypothetical protein
VLSTSSPSKSIQQTTVVSPARRIEGRRKAEAASVFEGRWYAESRTGLQAKLVGRMLL